MNESSDQVVEDSAQALLIAAGGSSIAHDRFMANKLAAQLDQMTECLKQSMKVTGQLLEILERCEAISV